MDADHPTQQQRFAKLLDRDATAFTFQTFADDKVAPI